MQVYSQSASPQEYGTQCETSHYFDALNSLNELNPHYIIKNCGVIEFAFKHIYYSSA